MAGLNTGGVNSYMKMCGVCGLSYLLILDTGLTQPCYIVRNPEIYIVLLIVYILLFIIYLKEVEMTPAIVVVHCGAICGDKLSGRDFYQILFIIHRINHLLQTPSAHAS